MGRGHQRREHGEPDTDCEHVQDCGFGIHGVVQGTGHPQLPQHIPRGLPASFEPGTHQPTERFVVGYGDHRFEFARIPCAGRVAEDVVRRVQQRLQSRRTGVRCLSAHRLGDRGFRQSLQHFAQ